MGHLLEDDVRRLDVIAISLPPPLLKDFDLDHTHKRDDDDDDGEDDWLTDMLSTQDPGPCCDPKSIVRVCLNLQPVRK